jgi:hypothetical protein
VAVQHAALLVVAATSGLVSEIEIMVSMQKHARRLVV